MDFLDHMAFVCLVGAIIGFIFLIMGEIFELINYLTKDKFKNFIANFFSEESGE